MTRRIVPILVLLAALLCPFARANNQGRSLILATTTSTRDAGLLDVLVPLFEAQSGVAVKVIAVGTGAALQMAKRGDADVVLTHAPAAERALVDSGDLIEGRYVMYNDFVLVGPDADPAAVGSATELCAAMQAIAQHGGFVSRGDDSGTHKMELELWRMAGVDRSTLRQLEETGQGMAATLHIADQRGLYTLSDRATYLAQRQRLRLRVVFAGDPALRNVYHAYVVNPRRHSGVAVAAAREWVAFLTLPEIQQRIAAFGRDQFGESLFHPASDVAADER